MLVLTSCDKCVREKVKNCSRQEVSCLLSPIQLAVGSVCTILGMLCATVGSAFVCTERNLHVSV